MYMNSYLGNFNRIDRARNINPGKNCGSRKTTRRNFIDGRKERNAFKTNRRGKFKPFRKTPSAGRAIER